MIVDDASTDNSLSAIKPFLKDKRIRLIKNQKNLGYSATQKSCADNALGDILGTLDPDDALTSNSLEAVVKEYKDRPEIGFVYSSFFECDENLEVLGRNKWVGRIEAGKTSLSEPKVSHFRTFRKSAYVKTSGFNPLQKKAVDKDIIYMLEEVTNFRYIDVPLYYYRQNRNGISQYQNAEKARIYDIIAKHRAYVRRLDTQIPNLSRLEMLVELSKGILFSLKHFQWKQCWDLGKRAIKTIYEY